MHWWAKYKINKSKRIIAFYKIKGLEILQILRNKTVFVSSASQLTTSSLQMIDNHSPSSVDWPLSSDWRDLDMTVSRDSSTGILWCLSLSTLSSLLCQYTEEILATHCRSVGIMATKCKLIHKKGSGGKKNFIKSVYIDKFVGPFFWRRSKSFMLSLTPPARQMTQKWPAYISAGHTQICMHTHTYTTHTHRHHICKRTVTHKVAANGHRNSGMDEFGWICKKTFGNDGFLMASWFLLL